MEGRVEATHGDDAQVNLKAGGALIVAAADCRAGENVLVAVRPEKIAIALDQGGGNQPNTLRGTVAAAVFSGSSLTYRVTVADRIVLVFEQNRNRAPLAEGSAVLLQWPREDNVVVQP